MGLFSELTFHKETAMPKHYESSPNIELYKIACHLDEGRQLKKDIKRAKKLAKAQQKEAKRLISALKLRIADCRPQQ